MESEHCYSLVKRDLGNLAAADLGQITRTVKRRLKQIQYRPDVVDGCLVGTGLSLDPAPDSRGDVNAQLLTESGTAASSPCLC
ncbi:hypothetical protein [Streptomyces sp. Root369]|uniref:hypothetical protein n=1 Tax=Streptomyces sp. Root369 TaxID=1736523 RepID=UPI001F5B64D2|nr:hypothetical protein [Streptomyces sp. Root369]